MKRIKKGLALIMTLVMTVFTVSAAFADNKDDDVPAGTPNLAVINGPMFSIGAGDNKEISLTVRNASSSVASSVLVTTQMEDVQSNPLSVSVKGSQSMGTIPGNATRTLVLDVSADKSAATKTYGVKVNFSFRNADSVFSQTSSTIYFKIQNSSSEPYFILDGFKTSKDVVAAGDTTALSFQVINKGALSMNGVTVSAAGDGTNLSIKGLDSKTFSKIHGGTRNDVSFQIEAAQNAENGSYPVTIKLTYKDENGKDYEKESKYYISVGTGSSTKADVQIANIKEPGGTYGVNHNFTFTFDLVNRGSAEAKNITVTANELGEGGNVVPKTSSAVSVDSLAPNASKKMSFTFAATSAASSRNYTVEFTVTYTKNGKETTFKQYAGANVSNPEKDKEDDKDEDKKTSKPKIIASKYICDPVIVMAGEEFNLTMEFLNTHPVKNVKNVKMFLTLAEETSSESDKSGNIFTPVDSSNTFYFDSISSKGTVQKMMRLYTVPSAQPKTYTLTVNFEYEDEEGNEYTSTELLGINVKQAAKVETSEIYVPQESEVGMPISVYFDIYNTGKVSLSNVKVKIEGDIETQNKSVYLGNVDQGESLSYEASFSPINIGENKLKITITGEEPSGDILTQENEYTIQGTEPMPVDDMEGSDDMNGVDEGSSKKIATAVAAGVIIVIVLVVVFLVRKNKKKKAEMLLDEEEDAEDITEGKK